MNIAGPNAAPNLPPQMQAFGGKGGLDPAMMMLLFQHITQQLQQQQQQGLGGQGAAQGCGCNTGPNAAPGGPEGRPLTPDQRQQLGQAIRGLNKNLKKLLGALMQNGFGPQGAAGPNAAPFNAAQGCAPKAAPAACAPKAAPAVAAPNAAPPAPNAAPPAPNAAPVAANAAPNAAPVEVKDKWIAKHGKGAYKWDGNNLTINKGKYAGAQGVYDPAKQEVRFNHNGKDHVWKAPKGKKVASPLTFDLNGNGKVDTTGVGKKFDINGDGKIDKTAWAGKGDGVLAFNGKLDGDGKAGSSGKELFGNNTAFVGRDGQVKTGFKNGFEALKAFAADKIGAQAVADGKLDKNEIAQLEKHGLTMNVDGQNRSLAELGIDSIDLGYTEAGTNADENGNEHRQLGGFTQNGQRRSVNDVWFQYQ